MGRAECLKPNPSTTLHVDGPGDAFDLVCAMPRAAD